MKPGAILFHKDFLFSDGTSKHKYVVVIGTGPSSVVVAKTTSKGHNYRNDHGCQAGNHFAAFLLTLGCCCLQKNTWICFSEFYEIKTQTLTAKLVAGEVYQYGQLDPEITRDVQVCAAGCDDLEKAHEDLVRASFVTVPVAAPAAKPAV